MEADTSVFWLDSLDCAQMGLAHTPTRMMAITPRPRACLARCFDRFRRSELAAIVVWEWPSPFRIDLIEPSQLFR